MVSSGFQDRILLKQNLKDFATMLFEKYRIMGPVKTEYGEHFRDLSDPRMLTLEYRNTHLSPKSLFLPQTEALFHFDSRGQIQEPTTQEMTSPDIRSILFGIRPCDAAAVHCLDLVFKSKDYYDPYYAQKRDSTVLIGLSCTRPAPTCFCTSVGYGPDSFAGSDILFFDLPDRYYVQVVTPAGEKIVQYAHTLLGEVARHDQEVKEQTVMQTRQNIRKVFKNHDILEKLDRCSAGYWEQLHRKCLGCGLCTFFCPTCHCFDITDDCNDTRGRRIRTWDSCMFPSFTLHASGHNPRPTQKERIRQRIMHKFSYAVKNSGCLFCVGCGRCVAHCPVNLDLRYVLADILEGS